MDALMFYDRDGNPIGLDAYVRLYADPTYRFLRRERMGDLEEVTAWLGVDQSLREADPPLIFGSAVLDAGDDKVVEGLELFAATEADALANHETLATRLGRPRM